MLIHSIAAIEGRDRPALYSTGVETGFARLISPELESGQAGVPSPRRTSSTFQAQLAEALERLKLEKRKAVDSPRAEVVGKRGTDQENRRGRRDHPTRQLRDSDQIGDSDVDSGEPLA